MAKSDKAGSHSGMLTEFIRAGQGSKACGKFSLRGGCRSRHDGERLPRGPSEGSPKVRALCLICVIRSRDGEDTAGVRQASSDYDEFLSGVWRQGTQGLFASILQDEGNRLAKARQAFFTRFPLAIGSGHFGAIRDMPRAVLLDNRRELIMHESILPPLVESNPTIIRPRKQH